MSAPDDDPTSAAAFEARYGAARDPWSFATSRYEQRRYEAIIAALMRDTYSHAFEPGCSVGELTFRLSAVCERVTATDFAPTAVAAARERCAGMPNVEIRVADVAGGIPAGPFDLIVFSEIGYYFSTTALRALIVALGETLSAGGEFIAAHWLGNSADHLLHGDAVHACAIEHLPLRWVKGARYEGFRIDSWTKS